jgi:hypothetical protein
LIEVRGKGKLTIFLRCLGYREVGMHFFATFFSEVLLQQQLNFALFIYRKILYSFDHVAKNHLLPALNVVLLSMPTFASKGAQDWL